MDNETWNLTQRKAMVHAGHAVQSMATGDLPAAWEALNKAIGFVSELIEDTVEHDDDHDAE